MSSFVQKDTDVRLIHNPAQVGRTTGNIRGKTVEVNMYDRGLKWYPESQLECIPAHRTGWVGKDDGWLVYDKNSDDTITDTDELSFISYVDGAKTATGDKFVNLEHLFGSDHNDRLTGDTGANVISGGKGDDIIIGGGGAEVVRKTAFGDHTVLWLGPTNTKVLALLENITPDQLTADDLITCPRLPEGISPALPAQAFQHKRGIAIQIIQPVRHQKIGKGPPAVYRRR